MSRPVGESRLEDAVTTAGPEGLMAELVRVQRQRQGIEEVVAAGNGADGFDHDEVRSGIGWHHQRTQSLVALWLMCLERLRVGGKSQAITASPTRQSFR